MTAARSTANPARSASDPGALATVRQEYERNPVFPATSGFARNLSFHEYRPPAATTGKPEQLRERTHEQISTSRPGRSPARKAIRAAAETIPTPVQNLLHPLAVVSTTRRRAQTGTTAESNPALAIGSTKPGKRPRSPEKWAQILIRRAICFASAVPHPQASPNQARSRACRLRRTADGQQEGKSKVRRASGCWEPDLHH